jgi:predicted metal-binding membrane protein
VSETPTLERLLKRDRTITLTALVLLCALSWLYILMGAGFGVNMWETTRLALFPHQQSGTVGQAMTGMEMGPVASASRAMNWGLATWTLTIAMWWIMMVAMMSPSAAPAILIYALVYRRAISEGQVQDKLAPTGAFAAGYLLAWLGFSVAVAALYWLLERFGSISAAVMGSQSRALSATVLIAAGVYQFSPLKNACLSHCRSPALFLSRHWRPHARGALWLGVMHGGYCIGCCGMLMTLLFIGGAMNLVWIAALALLVLIEKLLPPGRWIGRFAGLVLLGWGAATFMV